MEYLIYIAILVLSIVFHELSHGYVAYYLGDPTAKLQGRLTLNPIKHMDPIGSVLLPALLVLSNSSFVFGWAKPVPFNPYNLKKGGRFAVALVALAGPLANIAIAVIFSVLFVFALIPTALAQVAIYMNVFLALLNLVPVPPLDGSKVLPALLPPALQVKLERFFANLESAGFVTMLLSIAFLFYFVLEPLSRLVNSVSAFILNTVVYIVTLF